MSEKRIIGVNVSSEPCRFFSTPEGCHYGNQCIFRHPGDHEREEEEKPEPAPKAESEASAPIPQSAPAAPPKRWNVVKATPTLFAGDDRFPALGAPQEKPASDVDLKAIFTVPKKVEVPVEEVSEESEESEEEEKEETSEEEVKEETSEEEEKEETSEEEEKEDMEPTKDTGSHIHSSSTLVGNCEDDDGGEWIDSTSLSSFFTNQQTTTSEEEAEDLSHCVACCTGDYSMQNVLLQMNLRVLSYDNKRITQLRVYTRRCRDCFS